MSTSTLDTHQADGAGNREDFAPASGETNGTSKLGGLEPKFRFGAEELHKAYDILSFGARWLDLACLFRTESNPDGRTSVVVCETWRFTKEADTPRIDVQVRSFAPTSERPRYLVGVPEFPLLPATPKRAAWRLVLGNALAHFADSFEQVAPQDREVLARARKHEQFTFMRDAFVNAKLRQLERRLGANRINSLSETLSKVIWKHLIDPRFLKVVAYTRMLRAVNLDDYRNLAEAHDVFTRVYAEDRRMLPLCDLVSFHEYEKGEPFSIARWTQQGIDMSLHGPVRLSSPAAYRALVATHPAIVRAWAEISYRFGAFPTLFALLARIRDEGRIPQPVLWSLVSAFGSTNVCGTYAEPELFRLAQVVRQYVRECRRRKEQPQFRTYRRAIKSLDLRAVLDWCVGETGDARELGKNVTWASIERRSRRWHGRVWQAPEQEVALAWASALGPCEISGVQVLPLTTSRALWKEGRAMQHCVSTYGSRCVVGAYRVFALVGQTERATLGIIEAKGRWKVDQVRSLANGSVSEQLKAIARAVARAYSVGTLRAQDAEGKRRRSAATLNR